MLLKELYNLAFYQKLSKVLSQTTPNFDAEAFIAAIFDQDFESKELKGRMRHTTEVLHRFFPADFIKTVAIIEQSIALLRQNGFPKGGLEFIFFPDYIELYGLSDCETSLRSFEFITPFISCEFAVRPFILRYPEKAMAQMLLWSKHENEHLRRLASEGCRPRLPWAMALPPLKKDPAAILPILENLKKDSSEYVRRSVANNLNDISKDNPKILLEIAQRWRGIGKETDAILKHAFRTLLKAGNADVLSFYGLDDAAISTHNFTILTPNVKIGEQLKFSFSITNTAAKAQTIRLEYGIFFRLQNGQLSRKVFKISEKSYEAGEQAQISRHHSFRIITTRTYYTGEQQISVIVNGKEQGKQAFILLDC